MSSWGSADQVGAPPPSPQPFPSPSHPGRLIPEGLHALPCESFQTHGLQDQCGDRTEAEKVAGGWGGEIYKSSGPFGALDYEPRTVGTC